MPPENSLHALNQTLALLDQLSHPNSEFIAAFRHEIRIRLFDLRELWLRVIQDCRIEGQRRPGGDETRTSPQHRFVCAIKDH